MKGIAISKSRYFKFAVVAMSGLFAVIAAERFLWRTIGPNYWGPRFACDQAVVEFGAVPQNRIVERSFTVRNTGRQSLHIVGVKAGCSGCLRVSLSRRHVPPGGSATINARLDTSGLSPGMKTARILVSTNDPQNKHVILYMRGSIEPKVASVNRFSPSGCDDS